MNLMIRNLAGITAMLLVTSCVTTREELNRQREAGEVDSRALPQPETPAVKSEEIPKEVKPTPAIAAAPAPAGNQTGNQAVTPPLALPSPAPVITPPMALPSPSPKEIVLAPVATPTAAATATPMASPVASPAKTDLTTLSEDELRAELAKSNGQLEELQHEREMNQKAHDEAQKKSEERIAALEKQLKELTPDVLKAPEGKTDFEAGKDSFAAGKWDEAVAFFTNTLLAQETGKIAEEATYLRGEAYFKKLQYNKAIVDYSKFPERFQKSSYHPKALLRIAEGFEAMGRKEDAKAFYSDLIEKFPKTAEGRIAKKKSKK
jgi:TolA-binding protein